ncbi:cytochrome P450 3A8-like isoform X2 [Parasteatoda tepidariorum]|uniref:cytochrome P450 3A8-like isoform X1 n=1 Tax=Parasteatoda tepidariorum TaxID=114398 RepID=UPI000A2C0BBF|nr:cytochrome P450 3A8-like [Parasteatoda tepidariorum]
MDAYMDALYDIRIASAIVAVLVSILLYWYSTRNHDYWKKRGIPYVKPYPLLGSHPALVRKKNLEDVELERYQKYGDLYGYYEASKPVLMVSRPELLRDILVKDFQYFTSRRVFDSGDPILDKMLSVLTGEDWKRVRTIVSPTFSTGKIKRVMSIFQDCARTLLQNFKMESAKGKPVDVLKYFGAFTMDVIASSAFSTKIDSHNDPENRFVKNAQGAFSQSINIRFLLFLLMPRLLKKFGFKVFNPTIMNFFKSVTLNIIQERKRTGQTRNDFLQLLVDSATQVAKEEKWDEADDLAANYVDESKDHAIFKTVTTKRMSMDELVAQCVIFFLAGYHTTATTLGLTAYLLAMNPDVQEKVFKEISEVVKETNGELRYESVQKMKYLDNVVSEVLRIYSPGVRLERTADTDYKLGDTGLTIPKGMVVGIPVYAMHKDPKFFPNPEKFDPDRFSLEEREKQVPYSYLPFGAGPRNCVGMRFALLELKVCLIYTFSAFQAQRCSKTQVPIQFRNAGGLLSPKPIELIMEPRTNCPLKS